MSSSSSNNIISDSDLLSGMNLFDAKLGSRQRIVVANGRGGESESEPPGELRISTNILPRCHGSSLCFVGLTQVICGVKIFFLPPPTSSSKSIDSTESCDDGSVKITCNVEFATLSNRSSAGTIGGSGGNPERRRAASTLTNFVQRTLDAFVKDRLVITTNTQGRPDKSCSLPMTLKIDLVILCDDGCLEDALVPAALAAVGSTQWPSNMTFDEGRLVKPSASSDLDCCRLTLPKDLPVPLTFCLVPDVDDNDRVMCQPTRLEQMLYDQGVSRLCWTLTSQSKHLLGVDFNSTQPISSSVLTVKSSGTIWRRLFQITAAYVDSVDKTLRASLCV